MLNQKALDATLSRVGDLPAMPGVVAEVLRITQDPSSSMSDVTRCIESDPALTAKVLRLSNSSYYGMRQYVGTLKLALVILGVREVRNIVLGVSVFDTLRNKDGNFEIAQAVWEASLRVAGLSKRLGTAMGMGLQGEEFIAGLLTDIGKLVLLRQLGKDYIKVYKEHAGSPSALTKAEQDCFGYSHADAATALVIRWSLPQTLCDALWCQYPHEDRPLSKAKDPALAALVRIAKAATFEDLSTGDALATLEDHEAWGVLSETKTPIPEDSRRELLLRCLEEVEAAKSEQP